MTRVRLYEDIDGCLNASYNVRAWKRPEDEGTTQVGYMWSWVYPAHDDRGTYIGEHTNVRFKMEWNERLIAALNELPVEFVWTTTWRRDALAVGTAMRLLHDPQRVLQPISGMTTFPSIEWKFEAIIDEQANYPSPFIAVDDEWDIEPEKVRELQKLGGLVICPDSNIGLTPRHIQKMREYIARHSD